MNIKSCFVISNNLIVEYPRLVKTRQRIAVRHIMGDDGQALCRRKYSIPQQIFYDYKREPDCNSCLMVRERLGSIDWSKANYEIEAESGFKNNSSVHQLRKRLNAPPPIEKGWTKRFATKYAEQKSWDWTKYNSELAREHGVTRERVRQLRIKYGIGKSSFSKKLRAEREKWDWTKTDRELAATHSITKHNIYMIREMLGKPKVKDLQRRKSKWTDEKLIELFKAVLIHEHGVSKRIKDYGGFKHEETFYGMFARHGKRLGFTMPDYMEIYRKEGLFGRKPKTK